MIHETWEQGQQNLITFVMVDNLGVEVPGLGAAFVLTISKNGGALVPGAGVKGEIGSGWYKYLATAAEANTVGVVSIVVTGAGCVQQNLEYVVENRVINSIVFIYTVTNIITGLPIEGVQVFFSTDTAGVNVVWSGYTDTFGVARDANNELPRLDPGTYYVTRQKSGWYFALDTEVVS